MYFKNQEKSNNFCMANILQIIKKTRNLNWGKRIWKTKTRAKPSFEWMEQKLDLTTEKMVRVGVGVKGVRTVGN